MDKTARIITQTALPIRKPYDIRTLLDSCFFFLNIDIPNLKMDNILYKHSSITEITDTE